MSWPTKKLGEIAETSSGGTPRTGIKEYWDGDVPWLRSGELIDGEIYRTEKMITEKGLKESSAKMFPKNSVLIALTGATVGRTGILRINSATNQSVVGIFPNEKYFIPEFIWYFLRLNYPRIKARAYGGAQPHIDQGDVKNLKIPLPPLATQKQIVERLDKIAETQKLNDELIQKSDELFQSLLHKEFDNANKNWPIHYIEDMVNFSQLGLVRSKDKQNDSFEFNYIKMDNISLAGDLLLKKLAKVNAMPQEVQKFKLKEGDLIFNTRNTPELVGKSTIFDIRNSAPFLFNNNILRLRFKNGFLAEFLNYYLHTKDGIKKLNSKKRGTTSVSAIYQGDLFNIRIPIPSLEIQKQIVVKLSAVQDYRTQLFTQKSKLKELFDSTLYKSMNKAD